jgi:hypothetical protein
MRIMVINTDGGGFADYVEVASGVTVEQIVQTQIGRVPAQNYLIRVNRLPAPRDQVLVENDRVSITPTKIEGACG